MVCCLSSKAKLVVDLFQKLAFFDYLVVLADFQKPGYGVGNDENWISKQRKKVSELIKFLNQAVAKAETGWAWTKSGLSASSPRETEVEQKLEEKLKQHPATAYTMFSQPSSAKTWFQIRFSLEV